MNFDKEHISKLPIFFIMARGRSGSTLLRIMLDANPQIAIPAESRFVQYLYYKYGKIKLWDENRILRFYEDATTCFEAPVFDKELLKQELLKLIGQTDFSVFCKTAYLCIRSIFEKSEIKIIGDKNPRYSFFIKNLLKIFPEAKFIHLTRDYRDSTLSFFNAKGMDFEKKNASFLAFRWRYYNKQILKFKTKYPASFYTLKYEDLIVEPELKLRKICSFLNIDFDPAMLDYQTKLETYHSNNNDENFKQLHSALLKPINLNKAGIWKAEMKESDVKISDITVGKYSEIFGYRRKYDKTQLHISLKLIPLFLAWLPLFSKKVLYNSPILMNLFYKSRKK
jgi:hypothetical protein